MAYFQEFHWWYPVAFPMAYVSVPLFRAAAVVVVCRCVPDDLAKIALPLVLRPMQWPWPFNRPKE